ncbi:Usher syndrome type-1C protein-binding protein 1 isoform X2 [Perognathus longimembris pacificus]|uniref:Usher syndrome type-1C protein-binding protein 1 isoform X2 n=1 Tax=Perognathus longimembris pacificus TaxID=214514 RepID=UPI002019B089|nr:Usher syndrome type-1C protein-binding protein 1 isoform X2 [Perognathus longimembris pacificus]
MSARATRPRSRRGRSAPPGELDPVAESSEEAEASCGNTKPSSGPVREETRLELLELLEPRAGAGDPGLGNRTDQATDGDPGGVPAFTPAGPQEPPAAAQQPPEAAPPDRSEAPDVFQALQQALSSLEAAAAAWRCQPPGCPMPVRTGGAARASPPEVARLSERNTWLRLALDTREAELLRAQASLRALQAEKDKLQQEVQELQSSLRRLESSLPGSPGCAGGPGSDSSSSGADAEPWGAQESSLVSPLLWLHDSSSQILGPVSTHMPGPALKLLEGCTEQLCRMEKLKSFNRLLLAVLQGFKGHCEDLSMQLGRRAAEATALGLALQYSERCEEAYRALLALREADPAGGAQIPGADLQRAEEEACRLLAQMEAARDGETPQHSPEGSSVDKPTPQEVATQLQGLIQWIQKHRALLKIPPEPSPSAAAKPTMPHGEAMVQALLETQPGPALPPLEKTQIQQGLMATRETLADLMLQLQLVRREKRCLELREAALRAQGPVHVLLLEQLQWERAQLALTPCGADASGGGSSGDSSSEEEEGWLQGPSALLGVSSGTDEGQVSRIGDPEKLSQELAASLTRSLGLRQQLQSLRDRLEQMAQRGQASRAQSALLHRELCQTHSALVLAFREAHQKQEEQRRKLEQQLALMGERQAEELARLEATARALAKPRPPCPLPLLGETLL